MTDAQLYLTIGLPSFVALVGILVNVGYFVALNGRVTALEAKFDNERRDFAARFDVLLGKVVEIDNRLVRVEERLNIKWRGD